MIQCDRKAPQRTRHFEMRKTIVRIRSASLRRNHATRRHGEAMCSAVSPSKCMRCLGFGLSRLQSSGRFKRRTRARAFTAIRNVSSRLHRKLILDGGHQFCSDRRHKISAAPRSACSGMPGRRRIKNNRTCWLTTIGSPGRERHVTEEAFTPTICCRNRCIVNRTHRDIAMVFQNYALYPHMTVAENMSFGLRLKHFLRGRLHRLAGDEFHSVPA